MIVLAACSGNQAANDPSDPVEKDKPAEKPPTAETKKHL